MSIRSFPRSQAVPCATLRAYVPLQDGRMHFAGRISCLLAVLVGGCTSPHPDLTIHESPQGAVYLERISDSQLEASHPITLDPSLIAGVLDGIFVSDANSTMDRIFANAPQSARAFSDDDTAYLAPLISTALAKASSVQRVQFRVVRLASPLWRPSGGGAGVGSSGPSKTGSQPETTAGSIYAFGRSLHVTLTQYRHRDTRPDTIGGPNRYFPDPTGLDGRQVLFAPEAALRPDTYRRPGEAPETTLVIDYEALERQGRVGAVARETPSAAASNRSEAFRDDDRKSASSLSETTEAARSSARPPASTADADMLKDLIVKKDMELESLKNEVKELRRQLDERDVQLDSLRKKAKPAAKPPEALR
jgi:hypothetical protein